MFIELFDQEVHRKEDRLTRSIIVTHRVTARTNHGEWSVDFTYSVDELRRSFDPKRLHYHLNVSRNKVTRAAIEKEYGD